MSSDRGRSWRPEKKTNKRDSRRHRIFFVGAILSLLVGAVAVLIFGTPTPPLRFIVVTECGFRVDETSLTPLPSGATALNGSQLADLGKRFHEADSERISETETYASVAEFVAETSPPIGEKLLIYCAVDAWCVPVKDDLEKTELELLPAKLSGERIRFSAFLGGIKQRKPSQTVLLLELTGRSPGLASGSVADDIPNHVRKAIDAAGISGLTVICASDTGERSWDYVAAAAPRAGAESTGEASLADGFRGTAFGHFIEQAFVDGNATTASQLYATLKEDVSHWVGGHFGETQTVWMRSPDPKAATKELLQRAKLARAKEPESQPSTQVTPDSKAPAGADSKSADEKAQTAQSVDSEAEDEPVSRLKKLQVRRDAIANQSVTSVLHPVEWLQLHISLLAAERFAMTGNREEFDSMHDDVLRKALRELERDAAKRSPARGQQAADDWIAVESSAAVSADGAKLLRDFSVEAKQAPPRLPDEILENRVLRTAIVASVTKDLKGLSKLIAIETTLERRASLIQERIFLIQNLASLWPQGEQDVFPEQLATIKEVLSGQNIEWLAAATKPLDQLLDLRHQTLQLAAGKGPDGKMLRHGQWQKIAANLDDVLRTLHSAERWLCVGPEGKNLAEDRLTKARQTLDQMKQQVEVSSRLIKIRDAQRFEIPFLIQYFAMRLEETSLPKEELSAAGHMATKAASGTLTVDDFPAGQLLPAGFESKHIDAMFQLTRDFSKPDSEITESDEGHYRLLHEYVAGRLADPDSVSASEVLQLLTIPHADREKHIPMLTRHHDGVAGNAAQPSGRSGIWISFWSLRLVDAIEQTSSTDDWQRWSDLVTAISESKTDVPARRAVMASLLRRRWIGAMQKLKLFHDSEEFVPENELLSLISKDVSRRFRATPLENRSLYFGIQQALPEETSNQDAVSITVLNPDAEVSSDLRVTTSVRVSGVAELYVMNPSDAVELTNTKTGTDRDWLKVPVDVTSETDVSLDLKVRKAPQAPTLLTIVAVDKQGAAVRKVTTRLMPPADNSWEIEVWQVKEGQPDRQITLQEMQSENSRRLRLLPSTLDPMTQMDMPSQLKLRLRRTKGISRSVRIRALHAGSTAVAWSRAEPLVFPDGETVVDIPFQSPAAPPVAGAAPITIPEAPEISRGLIFEIRPADLPDDLPADLPGKGTAQISIIPRLLGPDDVLLRPDPKYDPAKDELVIPLVRAAYDDSAVLWPTKLPADVELSPKLQQCLMMPEARFTTPTLNEDGYTFRIPFRSSAIRKILSEDGLEFGVSVAGIPHAWWWTLDEGVPRLLEGDRPQVRTFLSVDNPAEVKPAATTPNLLLGENWDKAKLTARVFIHGGQFDEAWKMQLYFLRQGTEDRLFARDKPFEVRNRRVETVRVTAGENGVWQFSTVSEPYVVPAFTLGQQPVQNGTYDLNAELEHQGSNDAPITSGVRFTLDNTGPKLSVENVKLSQPTTNINGELKGTIQVTDQESDVVSVQVWLDPEMKVLLPMTPGEQVNLKFKLDSSQGFPMLPPGETGNDEKKTVMLSVEAVNRAGGKTQILKPVTFFRRGKAEPMVVVPGTIIVKLKPGDKYDVSISGKDEGGKDVMRQAPGSEGVAMFELPPGTYLVKWKPKIGSVSGKQEVKLKSNETVTTDPDRK